MLNPNTKWVKQTKWILNKSFLNLKKEIILHVSIITRIDQI